MSPSDSDDDNVEDNEFDNEDAELEAEDDGLDIGPGEATEEVLCLPISLCLPHILPIHQDSGAEDMDDASDEDEDDDAVPPSQMDVDPQAVKPSMHVPGPNSTRPPHQGGYTGMSPNVPNELIEMWSGRATFFSSPSQAFFITYSATQNGVVDIGEWIPTASLLCC